MFRSNVIYSPTSPATIGGYCDARPTRRKYDHEATLGANPLDEKSFSKRLFITGLLEEICQDLELTPTQFKNAQDRYAAVGNWLDNPLDPSLHNSTIYPQGSLALQTTVKPLARDEYDLDLICRLPRSTGADPGQIKRKIGDRLRANERYSSILEEKTRCWRLNYANEFHLDIAPSIPNPNCALGGELVSDKKLRKWKPTNPKGYRAWFERHAALRPQVATHDFDARVRADIEALPLPTTFRGLLRRCVQLCKRHRDIMFQKKDPDLAPISIILTTLAAKSFADCITRKYPTELDLLIDLLRRMPGFIQRTNSPWVIPNETTTGENFAERWNQDSRRPKAFREWHTAALVALTSLLSTDGQDRLSSRMFTTFGNVGKRVVDRHTETVSKARLRSGLSVMAPIGLGIGADRATSVRRNTFFGA